MLDHWLTVLPLVPADKVVTTAALGSSDSAWQAISNRGYATSVALDSLACEAELKQGLRDAGVLPGMRVLDAACGPGVISRFLLELGAAEVVGFDMSEAMLAIARAGPPPAPKQQLVFQQGKLGEPLPFADAAFDAVVLGDYWEPDQLTELRRVVCPGGRLIIKRSSEPELRYAWDAGLDARVRLALATGYAANPIWGAQPAEGGVSFAGELRDAGFTRIWTVLVERLAPVPRVVELAATQSFAIWWGAFVHDAAAPADRRVLSRLYDHRSPEYQFHRADGHFVRGLILAGTTVEQPDAR